MDGSATDSNFNRELQYHKLLNNICLKYGQEYTKELEPNFVFQNTSCTDHDYCGKLAKEPRRDLRVGSIKQNSPNTRTPLNKEGGKRSFCCQLEGAKGFTSCCYAPIHLPTPPWSRSTHKTRMFKKVTHCIFDMDGTVIDSESQYHRILRELCAKYGKKYTKELVLKNLGATDKQVTENVVNDLKLNIKATDLEKELTALTKTRLPRAPLKKGVERLMNHLVRSGVLLAMATNSTRKDVRLQVATRPKLFRMFHHLVCADDPDVDRGKPFPDLYLMAASKFPDKPLPTKCLVFEDSLVGLEAGLAAGMQVVMTPPRSLPAENCAAATLVLESLLDFQPQLFGLPPFTDDVKNKPSKF